MKQLLGKSPQALVLIMTHDKAMTLKDAIENLGGYRKWRIDSHRTLVVFSDNIRDWKAIERVASIGP